MPRKKKTFDLGKLFDAKRDAIACVSADVNQLAVLDAASSSKPTDPVSLPVSVLGPNLVVAIDIAGEGNTPLHDLLVPSIYNTDDNPNKATLYRNAGGKFRPMAEFAVPVAGAHANRITLKAGGPELAAAICTDDSGTRFVAGSVEGGQLVPALTLNNVPAGADFVLGNFRGGATPEIICYVPGNPELTVHEVTEAGMLRRLGQACLRPPRPRWQ